MLTWSTASAGPSYRLVPATMTTMRQTLSSTGTIEPASTSTLSFAAADTGIVEQNFDFDLLTPGKLMEKAIGQMQSQQASLGSIKSIG